MEEHESYSFELKSDKKLWDLLEHSSKPEVDPHFARRVLYQIAGLPQDRRRCTRRGYEGRDFQSSFWSKVSYWFAPRHWNVPAVAAAVCLLVLLLGTELWWQSRTPLFSVAAVRQPFPGTAGAGTLSDTDIYTINNLDEVLDQENTLWAEDDSNTEDNVNNY